MTLQNTCFDHWVKTYTKHFRLAIITPGGKAPALGKGWQTKASNNPDTVKAQAQNHPHCNLGIMLGEQYAPGLYYHIIDVDFRNRGRSGFKTLTRAKGLLRGVNLRVNALTGDGQHCGVLLPFQLHGETKLAPGVSIKGLGAFQIVEPSVHPRGKDYVWLEQKPNTLPHRVAVKLAPTKKAVNQVAKVQVQVASAQMASQVLARLHERWPILGPGESNDRSCSVATYLIVVRNLSEAAAFDLAEQWLLQYQGVFRTPTGLARAKLKSIVKSAWKKHSEGGFKTPGLHSQAVAEQVLPASLYEPGSSLGSPKVLVSYKGSHRDDWHKNVQGFTFPVRESPVSYKGSHLRLTTQESAFVEAVMCQVQYQLLSGQDDRIKFTREQIRVNVKARHGKYFGLDSNETYDRQVKKFFSQVKESYGSLRFQPRVARKFELLIRVKTGKRDSGQTGVPSEFMLSGVMDLLLASDESDQDRTTSLIRKPPGGSP